MNASLRRLSPSVLLFALVACGDSSGTSLGNTDTGADGSGDVSVDASDDTASADTGADATDADAADSADGDDATDTTPDIDPELDRDDDGLSDLDEITIWGTSPIVADTDGDGFSDKQEVIDLAFDPEVNNFQFNPLVADRPEFRVDMSLAPVVYATYETTEGASETIGRERSDETREANTRSWGGSNSYSVEQSHTVGTSVGFDGWKMQGSVSYEYSYSTTEETTSEWSEEQTSENATTLTAMNEYESSNEISSSGGKIGIAARVQNPGNIAYFLENLTVSAYQLDPLDPENVIPVATLVYLSGENPFPRTRLEPGETSAPLSFYADLDLPTAKGLLADSRNLMFSPATWLIEGDGTVDFELASTAVNARTAEIIIDFGLDRPTERYRVSTVANEDRNYITVDEALTDILRIPYEQGTLPFRRTDDGEPEDTLEMLTSVRTFGSSDGDATLWTVIHSYPIDSGANTETKQYHPVVDELDFGALQLQKGHTLQLVRIVDVDRDGLGERAEYAYGTDPNDDDTDDDGCEDGFEVVGWTVGEGEDAPHYRSDPLLPNTDFDLYTDCEEYERGTDPMSSDNTRPNASAVTQVSDGVRAVFRVTFDDAETDVLELRYTIDGGSVVTVDVSSETSPFDIERTFSTAGAHEFSVVAYDGELLSEPAVVTYRVDTPSAGRIAWWPIAGSTDTAYYGNISDSAGGNTADGYNIRFVGGRDDTSRGSAHTNLSGEHGIITTPSFSHGNNFTVSAWIRFGSIYSDTGIFGRGGSVGLLATPSSIHLCDLRSWDYASTDNAIVSYNMGGSSWDDDTTWRLLTMTVTPGSPNVARLYLNGTMVGQANIGTGTFGRSCGWAFGRPEDGEFVCGASPAQSHENGSNTAFDDIMLWNRPLTANEVKALYLN